jgi:hypothetical protein
VSTPLAFLRIEHKLDLLLHALKANGLMLKDLPSLESYGSDICPVCERPINLTLDVMNETYNRSCGCKPPIRIVPGISGLMVPQTTPDTTKEPTDGQDDPPEP